jgi:hypothetical protein
MSLEERKQFNNTESECISLLIQGKGITEVSKITGVAKSTVSRYKDNLISGKYDTQLTKVQNNMSEIIADSLIVHLEAMNKIAKVATDEKYIEQQDAKSLGELHNQLRTWTMDILTAGQNLQSTASTEPETEFITAYIEPENPIQK